jgi:TPR repeat protein
MSSVSGPKQRVPGVYLVEAAAATNDPFAIWVLGNLHRAGDGDRQDDQRSFELFEQAAKLGSIAGMKSAALCLRSGLGVLVDLERSLFHWKQAAGLGCARSQLEAGLMYLRGSGTPKNKEQGIHYLKQASMNGQVAADYALTWMDTYAMHEFPIEIDDSFHLPSVSLKDEDQRTLLLGLQFETSTHEPQDLWKAVDCYHSLVEKSHVEGLFHFGRVVTHFPGIQGHSFKKGFEALLAAAEQGHTRAMVLLGNKMRPKKSSQNNPNDDKQLFYVTPSRAEAVRWYTLASDAGDLTAKAHLALMQPQSTRKNCQHLVNALAQIAEQGGTEARCMLMWLAGMEQFGYNCRQSPFLRRFLVQNAPFFDSADQLIYQLIDQLTDQLTDQLHAASVACLEASDSSPALRTRSLFLLWYGAYQGDSKSMMQLGVILTEGKITPVDYAQALYWLQRASVAGALGAPQIVGDLLSGTRGILPNYSEAAIFYQLGLNQRNPYSARRLASMYDQGLGVSYRPTLANDLRAFAADCERLEQKQTSNNMSSSVGSSNVVSQPEPPVDQAPSILSLAEYRNRHKAS